MVAMQIMPWKNPFLWHNPCNWLHRQVKRHGSWQCQAEAAIANDESLPVRRKAHPPEESSSQHPSAHKGARTGCVLTLRHAKSLQKHCLVACKARVKQVRPWTCPSMVYVPLVMSDINRGNWASSIATLHHPPVGNEELRSHSHWLRPQEIGIAAFCG